MKPNIAFHQKLRRFIKSRKIKYSVAAAQIGGISPTGLSQYCDVDYVETLTYLKDEKIERIKAWMRGILLMEEAEKSKDTGEVKKVLPPPTFLDKQFLAADRWRRAKIVHAFMASPYLTEEEKQQLTAEHVK